MIERLFYPLSELANLWGCTANDLLHLGIQDRAQVCVNIYGMATDIRRIRLETDVSEAEPDDEPQTEEDRIEAEAHNAAFERWKRRTTKSMPHGVFELLHDDLRFIDMPSALPYELSEALKFDGGWWECFFEPPVSIELSHLCMLHDEVARLSCEVFGSATGATPAPGTIKDAPLLRSPVPRDGKLIETIAALLAAWPGGPSAVPSGKELEKAAQSVGLGTSDDTIRKALKAAQEAAPSLPLPK